MLVYFISGKLHPSSVQITRTCTRLEWAQGEKKTDAETKNELHPFRVPLLHILGRMRKLILNYIWAGTRGALHLG